MSVEKAIFSMAGKSTSEWTCSGAPGMGSCVKIKPGNHVFSRGECNGVPATPLPPSLRCREASLGVAEGFQKATYRSIAHVSKDPL